MMGENKNVIFPEHFLNMDINIALRSFKFCMCNLEIQMEGSLSQNCNICPGFYFIKCRN